jgi:hypothetical protein
MARSCGPGTAAVSPTGAPAHATAVRCQVKPAGRKAGNLFQRTGFFEQVRRGVRVQGLCLGVGEVTLTRTPAGPWLVSVRQASATRLGLRGAPAATATRRGVPVWYIDSHGLQVGPGGAERPRQSWSSTRCSQVCPHLASDVQRRLLAQEAGEQAAQEAVGAQDGVEEATEGVTKVPVRVVAG